MARKAIDKVHNLTADPYWMSSNSSYDKLGYIGFNQLSGEVAFFDSADGQSFDANRVYPPPGGQGYGDQTGRVESSTRYDSKFQDTCVGCHDNKQPRIVTPFLKQSRIGYRDPGLAKAFSLGELIPEFPHESNAPYRVVGSDFTAKHSDVIQTSRVIFDPSGKCTNCHSLTSIGTGTFASDAVGRLGTRAGDADTTYVKNFRTDWALRTGNGKIHPWMVPGFGYQLSGTSLPAELSDGDWNRLKAVMDNPASDARSVGLYTEAPAPEGVSTPDTRIGDCYGPTNFSFIVRDNRDGTGQLLPKEIQISWKYLNGLGGVPERDDGRFHLAILESAIPAGGAKPAPTDFPTLAQAEDKGASLLAGEVYRVGSVIVVKDISFSGHLRWTDPPPTTKPRHYSIAFPVARNKRYLIRLVAKRFCFDNGEVDEVKYSTVDHMHSVDVK